jgi:acetyltransferase-like isoleucine patch superfamily enzyme
MIFDVDKTARIGKNASIKVHGLFHLGKRSVLGDNAIIRGNNVIIGDDFFNSLDLEIGGGDCDGPESNLVIGDRCTMHNSHINIARPVRIGSDVGLSPDVDILTHGFWLSVLEGYPAKFEGVTIEDGAIIGWRSVILPGVTIGRHSVVGAQSVVTKDVAPGCVYAGDPAKYVRHISPPSQDVKREMAKYILSQYSLVAKFHGISPAIRNEYPIIYVNRAWFNVESLVLCGFEDDETDDFRDYMRRWGLRFYSDRPFRSKSIW